MITKLIDYFKAGYPAIAIQTTEETRAVADIVHAAKSLDRAIFTWSATEGVKQISPTLNTVDDTEDLSTALRIMKNDNFRDAVIILRDAQTWPFEQIPPLSRALRDLLQWGSSEGTTVVLIGPKFQPHSTIEKLVTVIDYTLPTVDDLTKICEGIAESAGKKLEISEAVLRALSGLTTTEAENACALSIVKTCNTDDGARFDPDIIYNEKVQAVKRGGLLELIDPDKRGLEAIGGLDNMKNWVSKRREVFSQKARDYGLTPPKGILLVGVPGTGKSLTAKSVGTVLGLPTLKLDIGALFNSLVGESESRARGALQLAEALAPCVLWIDEIDKGLAGAGSGGGDSGVTRRVFGTIINWMQERKREVFMVATANQVEALPSEVLRKGRFDEIFSLDLPTEIERQEIVKIQLAKKGREFNAETIERVAKSMIDFTGSEIEAVVDDALHNAFSDGCRELSGCDLVDAAQSTTPLATTAKEQIAAIRKWSKERARPASIVEETPTKSLGSRKLK